MDKEARGRWRLERGAQAERLAEAHLEAHGLVAVERNRRSPLGEIDLIMREGPAWVLVEVRFRASQAYGGALASLGPAKRRRMNRAALAWARGYAVEQGGHWPDFRLDLVAVGPGGVEEWIQNL